MTICNITEYFELGFELYFGKTSNFLICTWKWGTYERKQLDYVKFGFRHKSFKVNSVFHIAKDQLSKNHEKKKKPKEIYLSLYIFSIIIRVYKGHGID